MKFLTKAEYAKRHAERIRKAEEYTKSARENFQDALNDLETARKSYLTHKAVLQKTYDLF